MIGAIAFYVALVGLFMLTNWAISRVERSLVEAKDEVRK